LKDRNLTILNSVLEAAKALSITAHHGTDFLKGHAVRGLHSPLIAAEEVRQAMVDDLAAKNAAQGTKDEEGED
jgi:hypothetical protein